jgi:hypothetical protein
VAMAGMASVTCPVATSSAANRVVVAQRVGLQRLDRQHHQLRPSLTRAKGSRASQMRIVGRSTEASLDTAVTIGRGKALRFGQWIDRRKGSLGGWNGSD